MQNGISGNLLYILSSFLSDRKQSIARRNVTAGIPQGSILGPLLFFIYINYLSGELSSKAKLFPNDTSLLSMKHNMKKIRDTTFQRKITFNPDQSKPTQVDFSRKLKNKSHPPWSFITFHHSNLKKIQVFY